MTKRTAPFNYYTAGFIDGRNGNPKRKDLKGLNERVYLAGYTEGAKERSAGYPALEAAWEVDVINALGVMRTVKIKATSRAAAMQQAAIDGVTAVAARIVTAK